MVFFFLRCRNLPTLRQRSRLHLGDSPQDVLSARAMHETEEKPVHGEHGQQDPGPPVHHGPGHLLVRRQDSHQLEHRQRLCSGSAEVFFLLLLLLLPIALIMSFAVDWALKNNYLSIFLSSSYFLLSEWECSPLDNIGIAIPPKESRLRHGRVLFVCFIA